MVDCSVCGWRWGCVRVGLCGYVCVMIIEFDWVIEFGCMVKVILLGLGSVVIN